MDIHEACEYYMQQFEAAKQRELELLAVIESITGVQVGYCPEALREHEANVVAEYKQRAEAAEAKLKSIAELKDCCFGLDDCSSNALEHCAVSEECGIVAKAAGDFRRRAEAAEAKLKKLEMQEPVAYTFPSYLVQLHEYKESSMFEEASLAAPIPLYAKPFPAPKQEEK